MPNTTERNAEVTEVLMMAYELGELAGRPRAAMEYFDCAEAEISDQKQNRGENINALAEALGIPADSIASAYSYGECRMPIARLGLLVKTAVRS